MIHYLDTSALVKRYVLEPGSANVRALFRGRQLATSRIAHAELVAALARLCREGHLEESERDTLFARIHADFAALAVVEVRAALVNRFPELVRKSPLRGYDAVHLASALLLRERGASVTFWAADTLLIRAAATEGLRTMRVG